MLFNHHSLLLPVCQKVVYGRFHGTGWLKINFDGSKSKSRQGIGFFFCDETGRPIIAGRKALLYNTTHNLLELQAIIWGLKVINSSYKGKLMIEGDSKVSLLPSRAPQWNYKHLYHEVQPTKAFEDIKLCWDLGRPSPCLADVGLFVRPKSHQTPHTL